MTVAAVPVVSCSGTPRRSSDSVAGERGSLELVDASAGGRRGVAGVPVRLLLALLLGCQGGCQPGSWRWCLTWESAGGAPGARTQNRRIKSPHPCLPELYCRRPVPMGGLLRARPDAGVLQPELQPRAASAGRRGRRTGNAGGGSRL